MYSGRQSTVLSVKTSKGVKGFPRGILGKIVEKDGNSATNASKGYSESPEPIPMVSDQFHFRRILCNF